MRELIQGFIDVDNVFWGDDVYRWWFYIAILLILFFEKRRTTKITLAWYSIVFLICLFSPISNTIMMMIETRWQYRARLYSMLPIPYVLALGSILLMDRMCGFHHGELNETETKGTGWMPAFKLVMVAGVCILIVIGGTDVYHQDWMRPAGNVAKVPSAVVEIKEKLRDQRDITVAVPDTLSSYIRQVAPEFYTPYGRYVNEFGAELSQANPDPSSIMTKAGDESCNYIVVYDNEENVNNFRNNGYEPYGQVSGYLIYKVEGVPFTQKTYNEKRQLIRIMYLDAEGYPDITNRRYAGLAYEYDGAGNHSKVIYLDIDGNRKNIKQGIAAVAYTYTFFSHQIASCIYLDENDNPLFADGRYETRYQYNSKRLLEEETYYDQYGKPMARMDALYAKKKIIYDGHNCVIGEEYYDLDGKLINNSQGYARACWEYDEDGTRVNQTFRDEQGNQIEID